MAVLAKDEYIVQIKAEGGEVIAQTEQKLESLGKKADNTGTRFNGMSNVVGNASNNIRNKIAGTFPEAATAIELSSVAVNLFTGATKAAAKGATGLTGAVRVLITALISSGIGAIIVGIGVAIASMISFISKLDSVVDGAERSVSGLSGALNVLGARTADFFSGFGQLFSGDFQKGFDTIGKSIDGLGGSMKTAAIEAANLKGRLQDLQDKELEDAAKNRQDEVKIAVLERQAKLAKGAKKAELLKEAEEINTEILRRTQENTKSQGVLFAERVNSNLKEIGKFRQLNAREFKQIAELTYVSVNRITRLVSGNKISSSFLDEVVSLQTRAVNDAKANEAKNALLDAKILKGQEDRAAALAKAREKAEADRLKKDKDKETAREAFDKARIDGIENSLKRELETIRNTTENEIAKFNALEVPQKDKAEYSRILRQNALKRAVEAIAEYKKAIDKEIKELQLDPLPLPGEEEKKNPIDFSKELQPRIEAFNDARNKEFDAEKKAAQKKREFIKQESQKLVDDAFRFAQQLTDIRVAQIDAEIDAQSQKVDRFRELAEFGTAEQLQLEEERLTQLQAKREKEQEKQRKIAAVQIAINQAVSASETVKAITTAFGSDPTGINAILKFALLTATIGGAVLAVGNAFGALPAFKEGTDYVKGEGTETSDSILARLSKGERVMTAKQNRQLGMIDNDTLVKYAQIGRSIVDNEPRPTGGRDYTDQFNQLVHENRLMRKKLERLEIKMGISNDGIYGMVTTIQEARSRKEQLKA